MRERTQRSDSLSDAATIRSSVRQDAATGGKRQTGYSTGQRAVNILPFLLPALLIYGVFVLYPIINALVLSFFRWDGISPTRTFIGLDNYITIFTRDTVFARALGNSAIWTSLSLLVPTTLGLGLALALNTRVFGQTTFRTVFYLPAILATVAVATIWAWMYNPSLGIVNAILRALNLKFLIQDWLGDRNIAIFSVFAASIWQTAGTNMLLFLAGLQRVPTDLVEAAKVDGANRYEVFRNVTIPALRQTFIVVIALTIINSLKVFDLIYAMTYGGPAETTQVLATWSYFKAFQYHDFGVGMAVATVLFLITLVIIVPYIRWATREDD